VPLNCVRPNEARIASRAVKALLALIGLLVAHANAPAANAAAVTGFQWNLPKGFDPPPVPLDNPMSGAKVELGRALFFEQKLSRNGTRACSSCHLPAAAFTDHEQTPSGATSVRLARNSMTLTNVAYAAAFTWSNPNPVSLEQQMHIPLFGTTPIEIGMDDSAIARLKEDGRYRQLFAEAFPTDAHPVTTDHVIKAIATYLRTLISGNSQYDRYRNGDPAAMSESAVAGMKLFFSERGGCVECHGGINFDRPKTGTGVYANTGLYDVDGQGSYPGNNIGLKEFSKQDADMGKFKIPTLRNVELTAPYMHDGSFENLDAVIDHYSRGGLHIGTYSAAPTRWQDPRVRLKAFTFIERRDLKAFLTSLTDDEFARRDDAKSFAAQ